MLKRTYSYRKETETPKKPISKQKKKEKEKKELKYAS